MENGFKSLSSWLTWGRLYKAFYLRFCSYKVVNSRIGESDWLTFTFNYTAYIFIQSGPDPTFLGDHHAIIFAEKNSSSNVAGQSCQRTYFSLRVARKNSPSGKRALFGRLCAHGKSSIFLKQIRFSSGNIFLILSIRVLNWINMRVLNWVNIHALNWMNIHALNWMNIHALNWMNIHALNWMNIHALNWMNIHALNWMNIHALNWMNIVLD